MDIRFLTVKEGSTFHLGLLLLGKKRETALSAAFSKITPSLFTIKEGSTSHLGLLPSGKKRETALLGAQNRYTLRLAGHQSPRHILRDGTAWDASGNIFYVLDFGGVSEKSGVFRHIDVYK